MPRNTRPITDPESLKAESFRIQGSRLERQVASDSFLFTSSIELPVNHSSDLKGEWWRAYLQGKRPVPKARHQRTVRVVDLFSGPGGLANGLSQFFTEAGYQITSELAVDQDEAAVAVYAANHATLQTSTKSVSSLVDFAVQINETSAEFQYPPELTDEGLTETLYGTDIVLAGPPCQGHSNLNNHTRRDDPRNSLYMTVPAFAVAIRAPVVIIENVPAILHDRDQVVEKTKLLLESEGYNVTSGILNAASLGWAQARKRHFLIARKGVSPVPVADVSLLLGDSMSRSVSWAIDDARDAAYCAVMDEITQVSNTNQSRIDWLFENNEYNLDLSQRPESHKGGTTYMSVYGRMRADKPAPTITTGFMSPGRGRFVHPTERRVLTAREAARLQGFPDTFKFIVDGANPPGRTQLAKWIGDAVPMPLGFAAVFAAYGNKMI